MDGKQSTDPVRYSELLGNITAILPEIAVNVQATKPQPLAKRLTNGNWGLIMILILSFCASIVCLHAGATIDSAWTVPGIVFMWPAGMALFGIIFL